MSTVDLLLSVVVIVQGVYLWRLWQAQRGPWGLTKLWQYVYSVSTMPGTIQLRDEKEGTSCWLGPSGISFSGPGERIETDSAMATPRQGNNIRRIDLAISPSGRASLRLFGHREIRAYLGDYEQAAELGVETGGDVRFKLGREVLWTSKQEYGSSELAQIEQARKDVGALINLHGDLLRRIEALEARR
jgi:hypothetical protein